MLVWYQNLNVYIDVVANVQDCNIVVSEFKIQPWYDIHFRTNILGKGMNFLFFPAMS